MQKVTPGIICARSKGNPREQICSPAVPVCRVAVVVMWSSEVCYQSMPWPPRLFPAPLGAGGRSWSQAKEKGKALSARSQWDRASVKNSVKRWWQDHEQTRTRKSYVWEGRVWKKSCPWGSVVPDWSKEPSSSKQQHGPMGCAAI